MTSATKTPGKKRIAARAGIATALALMAIAIPAAANAEGAFTSYIPQGQPGFASRD